MLRRPSSSARRRVRSTRRRGRGVQARRGIALFVALFFIFGIGALALSAIYLTATATLLGKTYDKEDDLKYAAEAALAIGKADLNYNPAALPSSSYVSLMTDAPVKTADGSTVPGVTVSLYAGPTGSTTGQFGRFASLVAVAKDLNGTGFVRRLELSQESFAKYAYWTNNEGAGILFGGGDQLWGPVWSNDTIQIMSSGAWFHDAVGTAGIISGVSYGKFDKGYSTKQKPISLPSTSGLSTLASLAAVGSMKFDTVTTGDESSVRERIEFIATDVAGTGDSLQDNDGFFRVYVANSGKTAWLRSDWYGTSSSLPSLSTTSWPNVATILTCGDWHHVAGDTALKFFPMAVHYHTQVSHHDVNTWFDTVAASGMAGGLTAANIAAVQTESDGGATRIMQNSGARCYPGGDPHLVAVERDSTTYGTAAVHKGGDDTTFTPTDLYGHWIQYPGTPATAVHNKRPDTDKYLYPLYRGYNSSTKGVIYAGGTVGVSGVVRGAVTLYTPYDIVVLDDIRYANDPSKGTCKDILGLLAGKEVVVADNAINTPQYVKTSGSNRQRSLDDTQDLYLQSVIMALNTSFRVEDYDSGPTSALACGTSTIGRGCLYLTGGIIQKMRGAVGTSAGTGYTKRYSYDRCAVVNPPPYFPTTGRYQDNRYYELDPAKFDVAKLFKALTPDK